MAFARHHINPVFQDYFADPYIWRADGEYFAIGTGRAEADGEVRERIFPMLRSKDFYEWEVADNALLPPGPELGNTFWAPEVVWNEGQFWLYYSVGFDDKNHQLRVAVSRSPGGPYRDMGVALLDPKHCTFAIDAHAFRDDDGQWYLFYARDFLDGENGSRPGTALKVARMKSMTELEGEGVVVARARHDWQRFQAQRLMYDQVWDWHTLEGPFVRKHGGRYYCFYSGGRWENETYGVDYLVADRVLGPYMDTNDGSGPRVLKTVPRLVLGPGHNSIVTGPDGTTDFLVYHAWDPAMSARRLFIDQLLWTADGPRCDGPRIAAQA
jgi:GH43 family beta-xylosidase